MSYNVHNLIHIPDDYMNLGVLDAMSVRAGFKPLVQIGRHANNLNASYPKVTEQCSKISKSKCSHLDFPGECVKVYKEKGISFKPFTGKCSDSFVLLKDGSSYWPNFSYSL